MPAVSSSPIDPAIGQLLAAVESVGSERATVLSVLAAVADPRARRGIRHGLSTILAVAVAVCAVLAGARSFVAIAEWAADADAQTRDELGIAGAVPSESTIRRTLQRLDADAFDDQVGAWAQQRTMPPAGERRLIAVDGKTLRGSRRGDSADGAVGSGRHLLAALDHAGTRLVPALRIVCGGSTTATRPLRMLHPDELETTPSPKLRGLRRGNPQLSWGFVVFGCGCSDYFRVRGMVALRRSKAWRWSAVGSASMGTSVVVPAMRTWLRVRVARWSSRPPKLR